QGHPTYQVSWGQNGNNVTITVNQTQSHPSVSFYEMPIEIRLEGAWQDTTVRLNHTSNGQVFNVTVPYHVARIRFNPNWDLICGENQIINLSEYGQNSPFSIYPNPATSALHLNIENEDLK